jgi:hypothetical protein
MLDDTPTQHADLRYPDVFLAGAPKCGTTSIASYLARYDSVFFPTPREVTSHGSDLIYLRGPHACGFDRADYLSRFSGARPDQIVGASPVWSLYSANALAEIKADAPDARIVISLREPVSFLKAFHAQMVYSANETLPSLWDALDAEEARHKGEDLPGGLTILQSMYYSELPLFSAQVQRAFDAFGQDRVQVFLLDDIVRRPREVEEALCAFLGLAHDPALSINNANPRRTTRSALLNRLIRRPPPVLHKLAKLAPSSLRKGTYQRLKQANTVYVDKSVKDPVDPRETELRARYAEEVDCLSTLLDRDLTAWKSGQMV